MGLIRAGDTAPAIEGLSLDEGSTALVFYKVTCPVCQIAAPKVGALAEAFPGHVVGVGQDPEPQLESFARDFELRAPSRSDPPPYPASEAYGIEAVPTLVLVEAGVVADVVQSWDRDGYNRVGARLATVTGREPIVVSEPGDGLPPFRPG